MNKKVLALLLLLVLLLSSCSFDRKDERDGEKEKGIYPDVIMENADCKVGQSDNSPIAIKAKKMLLYSSDGYSLLEEFSFSSFSDSGSVETEGRATRGKIELDGSELTLSGDVTFSRPSDNMLIKAEELTYNKEKDEITTNGHVMVESEEGIIEGYDFKGDLINDVYTFSRIEKGDFVIE